MKEMRPKAFDGWIVVFLCLLTNWKSEAEAKNNFEMQTDNFTCSSEDANSRILKEFRCGISKSAKRRTWHMEFMLKQPVAEHDFFMKIVLPRRSPLADFVLLNVTTDGCQLLANRNQVPLMRLGRNIMERFSNFPKQCPFKANSTYYIRGFRLDLNLLPAVDMETPVHTQISYRSKHQGLSWISGFLRARVQRVNEKKRPK
ncbi:uncharacterized protein LOC108022106 [Drosophila biarmipes]|uniref:uncharacterized protein LOC108022106 n=1 Tax=Drosophila biarmipes TaxID=125945 RepID=UPI0007E68730|nr:uncharacterized protein LOC108022106 [Drosophila biarmipes]